MVCGCVWCLRVCVDGLVDGWGDGVVGFYEVEFGGLGDWCGV